MKTIKFTLFWLTGESQIVEGVSITSAMNNAGIGNGALRALDFWARKDRTKDYEWNKETRSWDSVINQPEQKH